MDSDFSATPPRFEDIVQRYDIACLKGPADLVVQAGGVALTKTGDLMIGDPVRSAMTRFVERWRHNDPALRALFASALAAKEARRALSRALNDRIADFAEVVVAGREPTSSAYDQYHRAHDAIATNEFAAGVYAAALILVVGDLLLALRDDIDAESWWDACGPKLGGHSLGRIVEAAGNNFRHYDEWAKVRVLSSRQRSSADVLAAALNEQEANLKRNACQDVLMLLSDCEFDTLARRIFEFAINLSRQRTASEGRAE